MTRASIVTAVLLLLTGSFIFAASDRSAAFTQQSPQAIVITGATVVDGTGRAPLNDAVVVITGDSITAVGQRGRVSIPAQARVIDAPGLVLAPGFIDAHNHSDRGFSDDPSAASQVSQGITTVVVGQDGGSAFPIGDYLKGLDKNPTALNVLTFVGHATLRTRVMGEDTNRHATPAEIEKMRQMVEQAMREGAMGLSSGLEYETGKPASTEEVIALARAAGS
ncbi:MAG TPA: amidohydrolase family protein, partial [Pyrinomonadaceae bacterium]|nr:amidohydrolase family protein [Pyrinomonadaceae bacterium]